MLSVMRSVTERLAVSAPAAALDDTYDDTTADVLVAFRQCPVSICSPAENSAFPAPDHRPR